MEIYKIPFISQTTISKRYNFWKLHHQRIFILHEDSRMLKNLLNIISSSTVLVTFLLLAKTTTAIPIANNPIEMASSPLVVAEVNLNVVSPLFQGHFDNDKTNPLMQHLGCSCAICTQTTENIRNL